MDPVIPDLKTLKLLILRTLSAVRHQHKFNLLGRSTARGDLESQLGVSFGSKDRHFAATAFDQLTQQGLIQPTYDDLNDPESWFAITAKGRDALARGVIDDAERPATKELEQKFRLLFSAAQAVKDFERWSQTDGLTSVALLFLDIDNFKPLNTRLTETVVDQTILLEFQQLLRKAVQDRGTAYRQGGEEFVVLLPNHSKPEAAMLAEKLRAQIEGRVFRCGPDDVRITVSVGVSAFPDDGSEYPAVLQAGNSAEHAAKKAGRNRVSVAGREPNHVGLEQADPRPSATRRLGLSDLFRSEFEKTLRSTMDATVRLGDVETAIKRQVYLDFDGLSKFVGYYISAGSKTYEICEFLASQSEDTLKALEAEMEIQSGFVGQRDRRGIADLKFVQQVVIYHEDNLTSRQAVDLADSYKKRGLALVLRGPEYLSIKSALQGGSS